MYAIQLFSCGRYHRPAIPVALALIAGILVGVEVPGCAWVALILLAAAVGVAIAGWRRNLPLRWAPLIAILAGGYLSIAPWVSAHHGTEHIVNYQDNGHWIIRGSVADPPVIRFGRTRIVLDRISLSRKGRTVTVKGCIRLTVMGTIDAAVGDRLTFVSRIRPLRNFNNPGGFDYRRTMAFRRIYGSAWARADDIRIASAAMQPSFKRRIHDHRRRLGQLIDTAAGEDATDAKAVLKALVFGDRSGIGSDLRERFNRSGAGHLLAISGLHVGIVAAVAYRCLLWVLSFCKPLLWRGWTRPWAAAVTVLVVLVYGVLAGMSPSTQRAVVMVAVFLAAIILGRSHDILNTLAVAALAILIVFPTALFSISFQLSFAAVLAIVYGLEKIKDHYNINSLTGHGFVRKLAGFILVSVLAIAGTTPIVLYHFNQTSVVGVAANILLVPLVGFVAVPLGLAVSAAAMLVGEAAAPALWLVVQVVQLGLAIIDFFSGLSFAAVKTVTPSLLEVSLYYLAGWALLNLRKSKPALWALAAVLVLAAGDGFYWSYQRFWRDSLTITAIDVGQGGATLLELPGGTVILYDGGGFSDNRFFDMGQRVVAPLLWRRKIATVDMLVLSHPNSDHLNGLIYIARHFGARELWTNGDVNDTRGYRELKAVCREKKISVRQLDAGSPPQVFGKTRLTVLHPPAGYSNRSAAAGQADLNNGSLVIEVGFGRTDFLLTGDIMKEAEKSLVERTAGDLASTVLFAPHHGSKTSSSEGLIDAVQPAVVVISAGAGNRFGFPHAEVLDRYRAAGSRILTTAAQGAITIHSDGTRVQIESFLANSSTP